MREQEAVKVRREEKREEEKKGRETTARMEGQAIWRGCLMA